MAKSGARQFAVEFIAKTAGWQKATAEASGSLGKVGKAAEQSADQLERAQAAMQKAVEGSARKIEQANERLADASAKVEIAEKKKAEAISRYGDDSSQAALAVLKLEQAERAACIFSPRPHAERPAMASPWRGVPAHAFRTWK